MKRLLTIAALALVASACEDPTLVDRAKSLGPDYGYYEEGPLHRAGYPCTWCHMRGSITDPYLDLGGTIYARPGSAEPVEGARVHLYDSDGDRITLTTNLAGNFFLNEGELFLDFPIWVKLEHQGEITAMQTPIYRERSCSGCHMDPAGPSQAGHIYVWEK